MRHGGLFTAAWVRIAILIALGVAMLVAGVGAYGHSHEEGVIVFLVGYVVLAAGALQIAHRLPPDSSPW